MATPRIPHLLQAFKVGMPATLPARATPPFWRVRSRPREERYRPGRTDEQRSAFAWFRTAAPALRLRVAADVEAWPVVLGKFGRLEWHDGRELAVWTDHRRLFAKLWAIPGVRRWQVGDQEVRGLLSVEALPAVAALLRARRRRRGRPLTSEEAARLRARARIGVIPAAQELA